MITWVTWFYLVFMCLFHYWTMRSLRWWDKLESNAIGSALESFIKWGSGNNTYSRNIYRVPAVCQPLNRCWGWSRAFDLEKEQTGKHTHLFLLTSVIYGVRGNNRGPMWQVGQEGPCKEVTSTLRPKTKQSQPWEGGVKCRKSRGLGERRSWRKANMAEGWGAKGVSGETAVSSGNTCWVNECVIGRLTSVLVLG